MKRLLSTLVAGIFVLQMNYSQDTEADFERVNQRKDWSLSISPYAWLADNATDVGEEKLRQSLNDLSSITNFGFQMTTAGRYKRFTAVLDWTYAHLGAKQGNDFLDVDYTFELMEGFPIEGGFSEKQDWWDLMLGLKTKFILSKSDHGYGRIPFLPVQSQRWSRR
jgi:hypothetical protein